VKETTSSKQEVKTYGLGEVPTSGDMSFDDEPVRTAAPEEPDKAARMKPLVIVGAAILAVVCIAIVAFLVFGGRDVTATVDGFEWQQEIDIEAFQTVTEEDWTLPTGARLLSEREAEHHTEQVLDHVETREEVCGKIDLGDGFFEDKICTVEDPVYRQESVYQPLYTYEIDKWIVVQTLQENGSDHLPYWPRADLTGDEREGERRGTYTIIFEDSDGEIRSLELSLDEWKKFENKQGVVLKLNAIGGISEVETN
jgi:hypothetical protein